MWRKLRYLLPGESRPEAVWDDFEKLQQLDKAIRNQPRVKAFGEVSVLIEDTDGDFVRIDSERVQLPDGIPTLNVRPVSSLAGTVLSLGESLPFLPCKSSQTCSLER